jgi:hypothetical protein
MDNVIKVKTVNLRMEFKSLITLNLIKKKKKIIYAGNFKLKECVLEEYNANLFISKNHRQINNSLSRHLKQIKKTYIKQKNAINILIAKTKNANTLMVNRNFDAMNF